MHVHTRADAVRATHGVAAHLRGAQQVGRLAALHLEAGDVRIGLCHQQFGCCCAACCWRVVVGEQRGVRWCVPQRLRRRAAAAQQREPVAAAATQQRREAAGEQAKAARRQGRWAPQSSVSGSCGCMLAAQPRIQAARRLLASTDLKPPGATTRLYQPSNLHACARERARCGDDDEQVRLRCACMHAAGC